MRTVITVRGNSNRETDSKLMSRRALVNGGSSADGEVAALTAQVEALRAELGALRDKVDVTKVAKHLPTFDSGDPSHFLGQTDRVFAAILVPEDKRVAAVSLKLRGAATAWFATVCEQIGNDWAAFKTAFLAHHQPVNTTFRARASIREAISRAHGFF